MKTQNVLKRVKVLEHVYIQEEEPEPYPLYDSDFTEEELVVLKQGDEILKKILETGNRIVQDGPSTSQEKQVWEEFGFGSYPAEHVGYELLIDCEKEVFNKAAKLQVHRRNEKYNLWRSSGRSIH
jgi:hypothetical protein